MALQDEKTEIDAVAEAHSSRSLSLDNEASPAKAESNTEVAGNGSEQLQTSSSTNAPSGAREILFLAVIFSSQLLTQCGLAMTLVPQHIIARSFQLEDQPGKLSWFTAGYSLTVGTFILIAGRMGDIFGHKRLFVGGFVWYALWSLLAGVAVYSDTVFFAFSRAMQGIGPAFLLPNGIAIIARTYEPGPKQNMIFGLFGATAPGGFALGAVFSSLIAERAWWPWAFWVMCFVCIMQACLGAWALPARSLDPSEREQIGDSSIWQRVDIIGSVVGVAALVLFNFAWNQGPVVGWRTPYTYSLLIVGLLMFVVFVLVEKRVRHPLIPFGVLKLDSLFTLVCITAGWASFGIFIYYNLQILQVERGESALLSAAQFSPSAISGLCAAVFTGFSLAKLRTSTVMLMAMMGFLIGGILIATMPVHQTYWAQEFVAFIVLPWGMDMSFPAATIILSRAMPREHQGLAASLVNTFVNYSISLGLGFAGTVDVYVSDGGRNILGGFRGAIYLSVGLAGLGVVFALVFCFVERYRASTVSDEGAKSKEPKTVETV